MRLWDPDTNSKVEDEDAEWARRFSGQSGVMGEVDKGTVDLWFPSI